MLTVDASVTHSVTNAVATTVTVTVSDADTVTDKTSYMAALHVCPVRLLPRAAHGFVTVQEQTGVPTQQAYADSAQRRSHRPSSSLDSCKGAGPAADCQACVVHTADPPGDAGARAASSHGRV